MLIALQLKDDTQPSDPPLLLNPEHIVAVQPSSGRWCTVYTVVPGVAFAVHGSAQEVGNAIDRTRYDREAADAGA